MQRLGSNDLSKESSITKNILKFLLTAIGLGIVGIAFGIIGAYIGGGIIGDDAAEFGALGLAISGLLLGYIIGIVVGIILIKRFLYRNGSLMFGVAGGIIGATITILASVPLNPSVLIFSGVFFFIVPVFCLACFQLKR